MVEQPGEETTARPYALALVLAAAMAVSTVAATLVGVLAPYLRVEIDLTPASLGILVAVFALVSGAMAWPAGVMTDAIGGRRALALVFGGSIFGLLALASAFSYPWLLVAMLLAGFANSAANPATNRIIANRVAPGARGLVAGIKMAGVQLAVFAAGILIPLAAEAFGWRVPLAVAGVLVCGVGLAGLFALVDHSDDTGGGGGGARPRFAWAPGLGSVTGYTMLMSGGASAVVTYTPLYSVEALGSTPRVGGLAVAVIGLLAIAGRLVLGRATERSGRPMRALAVIAAAALASSLLLVAAADTGSALFWAGVVGLGLSALSFIAGVTVAVIVSMPRDRVGGASGVMFIGFMIGFGGGPALFGALVEATGTYAAGWWLVVGLFAAATLTAWATARAGTLAPVGGEVGSASR